MEERSLSPPKRDKKTGGVWPPGPDSRVVLLGERRDELSGLVSLLAEEYPALAAMARAEEGPARPGDAALCLGRPEELEGVETFQEGYVLRAGEWVELTAQSLRGAVHGLRRMMELAEGGGVPCGVLADWPDTDERALHLDMGRKHYTSEWIARRIRDMSRNRMNTLWLHFSETEGFRVACDGHPEVPSLLHHSKEEICGLIRLANAYQIDVNPSLDSPGYLGQALREPPGGSCPGGTAAGSTPRWISPTRTRRAFSGICCWAAPSPSGATGPTSRRRGRSKRAAGTPCGPWECAAGHGNERLKAVREPPRAG